MKIALLTTQTHHHTWYLREIIKFYPNTICISETSQIPPPFNTYHLIEAQRDEYEKDYFFHNNKKLLHDFAPTLNVENINNYDAFQKIEQFNPDIIIVFGTRKINEKLISMFKKKIINLHGGNPEKYRGLDSHYWAIYHNDWVAITTTLHYLNSKLDDGNIIQQGSLDLSKISQLYQLRALNTKMCLELTLSALFYYEKRFEFIHTKQSKIGRYYSFIPADLKKICCKKFERHFQLA